MLKSEKKKAFSLLELSIVIVIIGVLLIGVIGSKHLIKKARINAAQAITRSSPISAVKGNKLWIESSLDDSSFGNGLTTGDFITSWEDNSSNNGLSISFAGSGPTYSNSINGVQAVKFGSLSATNHLVIDNPDFLNGTNYTIFFVEKRMATNGSAGNYLLGSDGSFALGYETTSSIIQTHGEAASYENQASIESVTAYSNKPRMISYTHSSTDGNKIYINGTLANEDSSDEAKSHLSGFSITNTLKIGNNYNGEIGEFAIFDRDIKNSERKAIEDYLSDKWNIPNNRDSIATCIDGIILSTGCLPVTCTIASATGYDDKTGLAYTTGGTFSCDSGYSGTISYECLEAGPATIVSGTCVEVTCTASGTGYDKAGLEYAESGSGSFDCDDGYSGTINYSCTESGAATDVTGTCVEVTCTAFGTGYDKAGLEYAESGSGSFDCDDGYSGTINYSCTESGTVTDVTGTCTLIPTTCTGGSITNAGGKTIHTFTSGSTDFNCPVDKNVDILVVAAGGSGGNYYKTTVNARNGGGGGGGVVHVTDLIITNSIDHTVEVAGTTAGTYDSNSNKGDNSTFTGNGISINANGGGYGGTNTPPYHGNGGSTGGFHWVGNNGVTPILSTASGIGSANATIYGSTGGGSAGGGGGATEAGGNGGSAGGKGGEGLESDISGTNVTYGSGGGGTGNSTMGIGGTNAGNGRVTTSNSRVGIDAVDGTGGGGGAASNGSIESGRGGSGIVIISY